MKKKKTFLSLQTDMSKLNGAKLQDFRAPLLRKFYRITGVYIAEKLAKNTKITPNQVTLFALLVNLLAAYFIFIAKYPYLIFSAILIIFAHILDYADGSLARFRGTSTIFGRWLDMFCDQFALIILFYAAILSVFRNTGNYLVWVYGPFGLMASLTISLTYNTFLRLHESGLEEIEKEKEKSSFLTNFYYTEFLIFVLLSIACLFNMLNEYLIFCAVYGWIFFIAVFIKLTKKIHCLK